MTIYIFALSSLYWSLLIMDKDYFYHLNKKALAGVFGGLARAYARQKHPTINY
jgi:hypothetical protein